MIYIDQLGHKIEFTETPKRIISLVPSQTEMLHHIGLHDEVVGITKFCIHPKDWCDSKPKIGGTKNVDIEKIKALQPDLIIGNKEENSKEDIEALRKLYPVWMSDIETLKGAFEMMTSVGAMLGKYHESINLKIEIEFLFNNLNKTQLPETDKTLAYLVWRNPYMAAGQSTFINDMITRCGFKNVFASDSSSRYPTVDATQLLAAQPAIIFLSSEPYPFKEEHIKELQTICPNAHILLVDGEQFSWYGSRLLQAPAYFSKLIQLLM